MLSDPEYEEFRKPLQELFRLRAEYRKSSSKQKKEMARKLTRFQIRH